MLLEALPTRQEACMPLRVTTVTLYIVQWRVSHLSPEVPFVVSALAIICSICSPLELDILA